MKTVEFLRVEKVGERYLYMATNGEPPAHGEYVPAEVARELEDFVLMVIMLDAEEGLTPESLSGLQALAHNAIKTGA